MKQLETTIFVDFGRDWKKGFAGFVINLIISTFHSF